MRRRRTALQYLFLTLSVASHTASCYTRQLLNLPRATTNGTSGSDLTCQVAHYLMLYSLAQSCMEAYTPVDRFLAGETDRLETELVVACSIYCLNPIKTAGEVCDRLAAVYDFILGLCCTNEQEQKWVFEMRSTCRLPKCNLPMHLPCSCLSTLQALETPFPSMTHQNLTWNGSCPTEYAQQMKNTSATMGCCFNLLLNTTAYRWTLALNNETEELVYSDEYWRQCNATTPGQCKCSYEGINPSPGNRASISALQWILIATCVTMLTSNWI